MDNQIWYDAEDHTPGVICEIELEDGRKVEARQFLGDWEDLEGRAVFGVKHWRFLRFVAQTPTYKAPFDLLRGDM